MHGDEKSDPSIVAGKPANGDGRPEPELVEPREETEENTGQASTCRTPSRSTMKPNSRAFCPWGKAHRVRLFGQARFRPVIGFAARGSGDEMALNIEIILDSGMLNGVKAPTLVVGGEQSPPSFAWDQ
jgi:hypothetical protein